MIRLNCDYNEGAHPQVLQKLMDTNFEQTVGYGEDPYCARAAELIKKRCGDGEVDVHFLVGGTQTNLTLIAAALRPHQGVISADTGHINVHESGAIEATGHKVIAVPSKDGKLTAAQIEGVYQGHFQDETHEHMVQPKLVYLSNPTEIGSIYHKEELKAISKVCREKGLFLYVDGARLGYALAAQDNDLDLRDFAELCDAFYIGGTKMGTLFGEALVISHRLLKEDFRYILKQKGGMLAKGRLLGLQFLALFEGNLYFEIGNHANRLALKVRDACIKKGYSFLTESTTNQQFPILPNAVLERVGQRFAYAFWQKVDEGHAGVRFCTSWATEEATIDALVEELLK